MDGECTLKRDKMEKLSIFEFTDSFDHIYDHLRSNLIQISTASVTTSINMKHSSKEQKRGSHYQDIKNKNSNMNIIYFYIRLK